MGSRVQESFVVEPATFTVSVHEVAQAINDQHLATGACNSASDWQITWTLQTG